MEIDEFIKKMEKQGGIDIDGAYGRQCVDLYNAYCKYVLDIPHSGAECAKYLPGEREEKEFYQVSYDEIKKGDIAVFSKNEGHVAIVLSEMKNGYFTSLDQNWIPQTLTEERHHITDYGNLIFYRAKNRKNIDIKENEKSIDEIAREVIQGKYGNGEERKRKLGDRYNAIQERVNMLLSNTANKSVEQIAKEVIQGKWGNGKDRKNRLEKAGYDYYLVQKKVNEML